MWFSIFDRSRLMSPPPLDLLRARAAVERMIDELGLRAFVYTLEPKDAGWELHVECAMEQGWQRVNLPVDVGDLLASLDHPDARGKLRAAWEPHFLACLRETPEASRGSASSTMSQHWEHFPHQADIGVRGFGATKAQAFEQAALAVTAVMVDPAEVRPRDAVQLDGNRLSAQAWGEPVDVARHRPAVEIKGATYTALRVACEAVARAE